MEFRGEPAGSVEDQQHSTGLGRTIPHTVIWGDDYLGGVFSWEAFCCTFPVSGENRDGVNRLLSGHYVKGGGDNYGIYNRFSG